MHYWQKGELPNDDAQLARIARMSPDEWSRIRPILQDFFHSGWKRKGVEKELAAAKQRMEAGRKGGRTTQSMRGNNQANVKRPPKQNSSEPTSACPSASVVVVVEREGGEQGADGSEDPRARDRKIDAEFEEWWGGYPHKVGKGDARKSFARVRSSS